MRRSTRLLTAFTLLIMLATAAAAGYLAAPSQAKDGLHLRGWLQATAFSALCHTDADRAAAFAAFAHEKPQLARFLLPAPAIASADVCRAFAHRSLRNLIVNAGETALRDCFNANAGSACTGSVATFKFHGTGSLATAAAETDTGCGTEFTTQTNPDNTRATGSQTTNGANVYRTVGTVAYDATATAREWCLMNQAATGGGTIWSHVIYSDINVASGDSIQFTYDLTIE